MTDKMLCGILTLLVPQIVSEIMAQESVSEETASVNLYRSKLYSDLENEATKLWHLSPKALYELYRQEQETGVIEYPEEA